jgi:predicted negative regulator of RcsB-dependent stress response
MSIHNIKYIGLAILLNYSMLSGQETLKEQYEYSVSLYKHEKYFDAVTELKRLNFFDKGKEYAYRSNLLLGKSYKEGAKFSDALKYFTLAEMNAANDSDLFEAKIYAARINILRRTTDYALRQLDQLRADKRFDNRRNEIIYWKGWAYVFADDCDKAAEQFAEIKNDSLEKLCRDVSSDKYNATTAKVLSYIIPGAGQFYTGHYFSGFLSLGWNVLWGYLTVKAFVDERIFDGFVIGNFLWLRFYTGNLQNAEKFAREENLEIANKALAWLQYQYKGEKP